MGKKSIISNIKGIQEFGFAYLKLKKYNSCCLEPKYQNIVYKTLEKILLKKFRQYNSENIERKKERKKERKLQFRKRKTHLDNVVAR